MHLYYCKEVSIKEMRYLGMIQEGVNAFPWFRDNTRYDFLIQPICTGSLRLTYIW